MRIFASKNFDLGVELMRLRKKIPFLTVCPKRIFLIPFFCICFLLQTVQAAEPQMLVPVGKTVGVTMDTKGLLVLGTGSVTGEDNCIYTPCKGILQAGDLLLEADGQMLENKEMFMEAVEKSQGDPVFLRLERSGREKNLSVTPVFSAADGSYKIGAWIRDSIQGIGTVPIDNMKPVFEVGSSSVFVFQIIGVFPHVTAKQGAKSAQHGNFLVRSCQDHKLLLPITG